MPIVVFFRFTLFPWTGGDAARPRDTFFSRYVLGLTMVYFAGYQQLPAKFHKEEAYPKCALFLEKGAFIRDFPRS